MKDGYLCCFPVCDILKAEYHNTHVDPSLFSAPSVAQDRILEKQNYSYIVLGAFCGASVEKHSFDGSFIL